MARQATSPEERAQIARVRGLLSGVIFDLVPDVVVTGTNRKKTAGQLVRDVVVNKPGKSPAAARVLSGVVTLATRHGNVEIDYLDIVWVEKASKPLPGSPTTKKQPAPGRAVTNKRRGRRATK
jgi:hypothetical protein